MNKISLSGPMTPIPVLLRQGPYETNMHFCIHILIQISRYLKLLELELQCSTLIMLCLGSIGMDRVIYEMCLGQFYIGTIGK